MDNGSGRLDNGWLGGTRTWLRWDNFGRSTKLTKRQNWPGDKIGRKTQLAWILDRI
ncbi:hypothetical protein RclHR1_14980001 [Rhizophagus clarus]|uniref:Uncharacterized protein n=1 Tax=Rhizophagus clarus TaxID=94130 RepID=A0A2Z6R6I2_9GLOM|nr:hypothetical protein RclHR1_14980001 [Rhizophagus clarus]GES93336.1 hypothetical protein RCL_e2674_RclHR1_14980001 [Rhizophagus clarus]